jgi:5-methylcytosine-specific restriction protein B
MSLADKIREFVFENYIKPAREKGDEKVSIKAGDIHDEMELDNKIPSVCGALDTKKFQKQYDIELEEREGPSCGFNVFYTFRV